MKTVLFALLIISFISVSKAGDDVTLATVSFYQNKGDVEPTHHYEIIRTTHPDHKRTYVLNLKGMKSKSVTKEQVVELKSEINKLIKGFKTKPVKDIASCERIYANLTTDEDSTKVCNDDQQQVAKTSALLNRLSTLVE